MRGLREGGGSCLKYLKREWNKKMGGETKILKRGGKLGQGMGALTMIKLKLTNYDSVFAVFSAQSSESKKTYVLQNKI